MLAFFNPQLQVLDQMGRRMNTPLGRKRIAFVTAALAASYLAAMAARREWATEQQEGLYKDLTVEEKSRYIYIPAADGVNLKKIRMPENMSFAGSLLSMILEQGQQEYKPTDFLIPALTILPDQFRFYDPTQLFLSWMPHVLKTGVQGVFNKKTFPRVRDIVGPSLRYMPKYKQVYQNTSMLAKYLGEEQEQLKIPEEFQLSPIMIDFYLEGIFGRFITFFTGKKDAYDFFKGFSRKDYFYSGRSLQRYYSTVNKFNKLKDRDEKTAAEKRFIINNASKLKTIKLGLKKLRKLDQDKPEDMKDLLRIRAIIRDYIWKLKE